MKSVHWAWIEYWLGFGEANLLALFTIDTLSIA